jgi:hypothetical protein
MRNIFLASQWAATALAIALFAVTGDIRAAEPHSQNKAGGGAKSNAGKAVTGNTGKAVTGNTGKAVTGNTGKAVTGNTGKAVTGSGPKPGNKGPGKASWNNWTKNGWNKNGWNNNFNSQHQSHHHGYWNNGIWVLPLILAYSQPWVYLQPAQPIVVGQKWLGVTYEPYDGGGAYVTGIYEGSPAQQIGLEVGDVIVSIDGVDAAQLPAVIQASPGTVTLQVLSGRTGDLVQQQVNLIR